MLCISGFEGEGKTYFSVAVDSVCTLMEAFFLLWKLQSLLRADFNTVPSMFSLKMKLGCIVLIATWAYFAPHITIHMFFCYNLVLLMLMELAALKCEF